MIHWTPCRSPCRLYIHLAFTYSVGPLKRSVKRTWTSSAFSTRWECLKCNGHGLSVSCVMWPEGSHFLTATFRFFWHFCSEPLSKPCQYMLIRQRVRVTSHMSQEPWLWNCESPKGKCPKVVPIHLRDQEIWSRILKCSVKPRVTRPSTKCYFNELSFMWVFENSVRVTSHTKLRARDQYTSSTLIGEKGGFGPSSLHTMLEGLPEYVNARCI